MAKVAIKEISPKSNGCRSLALSYSQNGRRRQEVLRGLYVMPIPKEKELAKRVREQNKEVLRMAENLRLEKELQLSKSVTEGKVPSLLKYCETVMRRKRTKGEVGYRTLLVWKNSIGHLEEYIGTVGDMPLDKLTVGLIEDFKVYLKTKRVRSKSGRLNNNSVNVFLSKLHCVLDCALEEGFVSKQVVSASKGVKGVRKDIVYLTEGEIGALWETECPIAYKIALFLGIYSGLRIGDIKRLDWREHIKDKTIEIVTQKTKKLAVIPISNKLREVLELCAETYGRDGLVFKGRITNQSTFDNWAKRSGVDKHIHPHIGRHTFATLLLSKGADITAISELLTHSNVSTTQRHYAFVTKELRERTTSLFDS